MKKTPALLLSILVLTIALASCNVDGTSGILWDVAQSKTPLSIRYKQLLGDDGTYLYFRTAKGVERVTTAKVSTPVATSEQGKLIQAASFLQAPDNKVFYITNNETERTSNIINIVDTTILSNPITSIAITTTQATSINSALAIKNLYANSMVLMTGKDVSNKKVFELLEYSNAAPAQFKTSIAKFPALDDGYDLENLIQQTTKEQSNTAHMIVSFINGDGDQIHYLVDPSTPPTPISLGTQKVQIANFLYKDANNMYVLTTGGKIYHVDSGTKVWTSIGTSSKTYAPNAFALAVDDGTKYHLITKPSSKTAALHVFSFPNALPNTAVAAGIDVKSGYAKELALSTIVSAQVTSGPSTVTSDILVATNENGMYDISITHTNANVDDSTNGSTSSAEDYSF